MRYVLLLPLLITLFILDRVFFVLVFWEDSIRFNHWLYKDELIIESIFRVTVGVLTAVLIEYSIAIC